MALPPYRYYHVASELQRVRRLSEECLEVAFLLCNAEMEEFGFAKIFDIFYQCLSTAYVLNTGYWSFYSSIDNQCLCVCARFGIRCRHTRSLNHWIDMQAIPEDSTMPKFYPSLYGHILPRYRVVTVAEAYDTMNTFDFTIDLRLVYKKLNARTGHYHVVNYNHEYCFIIRARMFLVTEYFHPGLSTMFQPNPFHNPRYAGILRDLVQHRDSEPFMGTRVVFNMWYAFSGRLPKTTFVLGYANLPLYAYPKLVRPRQPWQRNDKTETRDKETQTSYPLQQTGRSLLDLAISSIEKLIQEDSDDTSTSLQPSSIEDSVEYEEPDKFQGSIIGNPSWSDTRPAASYLQVSSLFEQTPPIEAWQLKPPPMNIWQVQTETCKAPDATTKTKVSNKSCQVPSETCETKTCRVNTPTVDIWYQLPTKTCQVETPSIDVLNEVQTKIREVKTHPNEIWHQVPIKTSRVETPAVDGWRQVPIKTYKVPTKTCKVATKTCKAPSAKTSKVGEPPAKTSKMGAQTTKTSKVGEPPAKTSKVGDATTKTGRKQKAPKVILEPKSYVKKGNKNSSGGVGYRYREHGD